MSENGGARDGLHQVDVVRPDGTVAADWVAVEEPLAIDVDGSRLAITMRTPGDDRELVAGFLHGEGIVRERRELLAIAEERDETGGVRVTVELTEVARERRLAMPPRELQITSACGVCGRVSLEDLWRRIPAIVPLAVASELAAELPERMRPAQRLFARSGGMHGAALFTPDGRVLVVREDIGRHNAVDKVVGWALFGDQLPLSERILVVSGRAGFEIVQKAAVAGVPVVVAVGAASSLALEVASLAGLELHSFVRRGGGNRHRPITPRITRRA